MTMSKFRNRKRKFLCCFNGLHEAGMWKKELSCCIRAMTAKKCTKKRDACAKLFFFLINLLFFYHSCNRRHCRCLSSLLLWSRNFATMVMCYYYYYLFILFFLIYFFGYVLAVFCWRKFLVSCCSQWNEREQEAEGLLWLHQLNRSNR